MPDVRVPQLLRAHPTETWLVIVLIIMSAGLSLASDKFFTVANLFNLLNTSSTNLIFAVGLLVVLIAGGIDISFAVAASVVQYVVALALARIGGGDWFIGLALAAIAGSTLGANGLATAAFVNTHVAAAMAALAWVTASWIRHGRPSVVGGAAGAVAGLVGITPAAGFVTPMAALIIGFLAGVGCFLAVEMFVRGRVDDALDVFGVHGVGGMIGALATGIFATTTVNSAGFDGLLYGNPGQLLIQAIAVVVVAGYAAVVTWGLLKLVNAAFGIRVSSSEEHSGLDVSQHGEVAYQS